MRRRIGASGRRAGRKCEASAICKAGGLDTEDQPSLYNYNAWAELACANKLYVVVFVTGVMISPSVVRVAALVPDPIQQIKDGGATYEMNELVFSPRYFNVVVTLPH